MRTTEPRRAPGTPRPRRAGRAVRRALPAWAVAAALLAGCTPERTPADLVAPEAGDELVLDAVLIVDRAFPRIYLSRTVDPLAPFSFGALAEPGATIVIDYASGRAATYEDGAVAGSYEPRNTVGLNLVRPLTRYDITVTTADGRVLTGSTTTPARFSVDEWVLLEEGSGAVRRRLETFDAAGDSTYDRNTLVYSDGLLEARFQRPDVPAFQVAVRNLEDDSPLLVDPDFLDEEDLAKLERSLSSPALTGESSTLRLPWLAIYFEGRTVLRVNAIDRNWFDLIRSTPGLDNGPGAFAFGGNLGEGFEQPIFHLEGGIGLFGSASVDSIGFRVVAP